MHEIKRTKDHDGLFYAQLDEVARDLSTPSSICNPKHLIAVMKSESDARADAHNDNPKHLPPERRWNASGLIQFMPATLPGVGWSRGHAAFRKELNATKQLPYVRRYFSPYRGQLGSIGQIYVATFLPALLGKARDPEFVLCAKDGPLGWAYGPNAVFDTDKDFKIKVRELEEAVVRNCRGPRWAEMMARMDHGVIDPDLVEMDFDLGTTAGLQKALSRLGFDPGPLDGYPGPRTTAGLLKFQQERGLVADGIYGPLTRAAIALALKTAA